MKQQSTNYGRLRECLPMGSQFVVEEQQLRNSFSDLEQHFKSVSGVNSGKKCSKLALME